MSSISAGTTSTTTLVHSGDTTGSLVFKTNDTGSGGTTAVTIDTSQNVGIGTTSPTSKFDVLGSGTTYSYLRNSTTTALTAVDSSTAYFGSGTNSPVVFQVNNGEKMRIDSSGNLLVGTTSAAGTSTFNIVRQANTATYIYMLKNTQLEMTMGCKASTDTNFYIGSGSSTIGQNGVYLTAAGNSWNAVSDERQKNIIETIENGLEKVNALRAVIGSYKHDTKKIRRPFLIAQDVQAVLPEAVNIQDEETGTLGMSYTDVIPLLVASIKELKAINDQQAETINALTARVVALESRGTV